ncbi:MAG: hypothetical protein FD135_4538 [Comamonadaceae bacterium]|nr:MAG: hypothetical protein FD135_4538 [Comamonadaceae bacterium]
MSAIHAAIHPLTEQARVLGPALLAGVTSPHDECLAMVWGPRFDREHGLELISRQSSAVVYPLPTILKMLKVLADQFDGLAAPEQHRLRRLILRHRAWRAVAM